MTERHTVEVHQDGETFTLTAIVTEMRKREEACDPLLGGDRIGLEAHLQLLQGGEDKATSYFLSRLVGEPCWIIDAKFGPHGYPHFSHGFGARYLKLKGILPELGDLLDTLARKQDLAARIGRDIPLVLAGE